MNKNTKNILFWKYKLNNYGMPDKIILLLFLLAILSTAAELIGIGVFLPLFELLKGGEFINNKDGIVYYFYTFFDFFGLELSLPILLISAFFLFLISKFFLYLVGYTNAYYLGKMVKNLRDDLLKLYLNSSPAYYDKVGMGDFINRSTVELPAAVSGVMAPLKFLVTIVTVIGSIIMLMLVSYELTTLTILISTFSLIYPYRWVKATTQAGRKNSHYNSTIVSFLLGRLGSPRLVRLTGMSKSEVKAYSKITEKQRNLTLAIHLLKARVNLVLEPVIIGISLMMLYIALTVFELDLSIIVLYLVIMIRLVPMVNQLLAQKQTINRSKGPINAMDNLLQDMKDHRLDDLVCKSSEKSLYNINKIHSIKFEKVSFTYAERTEYALNNIDLKLESPSLNAIVGPSGSGKSTLIDIVSGYRHKTNGSIFINDFNINDLDYDFLLSRVSFVPQEPQILDGTVEEHISYGKDNYSNDDLVNAAKLSGSYDFIKNLPEGFNTQLRENANNLSGGQKKRLDVARALFSKSSLLILDEPTGNLDSVSERNFTKIIQNIRDKSDTIIVIITHQLNTIYDADQILVVEKGEVTGTGKHSELVKSNKWYYEAIKD